MFSYTMDLTVHTVSSIFNTAEPMSNSTRHGWNHCELLQIVRAARNFATENLQKSDIGLPDCADMLQLTNKLYKD